MIRLKPLKIHSGIFWASIYLVSYLAWIQVIKLLALTLMTWFLKSPSLKLNEISDAYSSSEILIMAIASFTYVASLNWLNPLTVTSIEEIIALNRIRTKWAPGVARGVIVAFGIALAFVMSGHYRYLGFFIQSEDTTLALINILIRSVAIFALIYCEEFLFRQKILNHLRKRFPEALSVVLCAAVYTWVKGTQFDLGFVQLLTLFLLACSLGMRASIGGDFAWGAGFLAGMVWFFHPGMSLPVFGAEFQGIFLLRYEPGDGGLYGSRLVSGGLGGPLSSLALQLVLITDLIQNTLRNRKFLWPARFSAVPRLK